METPNMEELKERLLAAWQNLVKKSDEDNIASVGRERIIVFLVAFILAMGLWLLVNLSRDYNLNVDLPIALGSVPTEKALLEELPEEATVSVTGEGWKLINFYNNPPSINIDVSDTEVNLFDQVQQQMNALPDISVQKVQPLILTVELEERTSQKVPIRSSVTAEFKKQYDFIDKPTLQPDSVTISGAASLVNNIKEWPTDSVRFENISSDISQVIPLKAPGELLSLSKQEVIYNGRVSQYTEGEAKVKIDTRNLPSGRMVSFSPLSITVKYDVPIDEYAELKDQSPFRAFVTYRQLQQDSTGFIVPQIEQLTDQFHIKVRSFQPRNVAYFMVVGDQQ